LVGGAQPLARRQQLVEAHGAIHERVATDPETASQLASVNAQLTTLQAQVLGRAGKESEIPNFKGSSLGRFPLVSADFWTSDHLSERSRSVDAFPGTRARGTLTLKRR